MSGRGNALVWRVVCREAVLKPLVEACHRSGLISGIGATDMLSWLLDSTEWRTTSAKVVRVIDARSPDLKLYW